MKLPYPMLDILIFLLRLFGWIQIAFIIYIYFTNYNSTGISEYSSYKNEFSTILKIYQLVIQSVLAFLTFVIAELLKLGIDISINTKETAEHLVIISTSLHERDKVIMKMMGIIVDQMKNK
jgi:hypothetical protein